MRFLTIATKINKRHKANESKCTSTLNALNTVKLKFGCYRTIPSINPYRFIKHVPLPVLQKVAKFTAKTSQYLPSLSIRHKIQVNLSLVYPTLTSHQRHKLQQETLTNQLLSTVESAKVWAMPPEWSIQQIKQVHQQHLLMEALNNPKGMLAIVPHLGTWEMMNAWLNQHGAPTIMYKPLSNKLINDFVLTGRQRLNATLVPTNATGIKAIFKTLKKGGFSIILPDHVPPKQSGVVVPFFGIHTLTSTLAAKLASKTQCALIGLACIRREDGQGFDIYCYDLNNPDLYHKDVYTATTALNQAMQTMINDFAAHYMWGYKRFKYVPNIDNPYDLSDQDLTAFKNNLGH